MEKELIEAKKEEAPPEEAGELDEEKLPSSLETPAKEGEEAGSAKSEESA
jgi:hypothetical protein